MEKSRMKKSLVALTVLIGIAVGATAATAVSAATTSSSKEAASPPASGSSGAVAVAWNQELLHIVQTAGAQPPTVHATRSFAILQAAIYDSVVSVTKDDRPYLVSVPAAKGTRVDAAAAQAGHDTLASLYPKFSTELDGQLATELAAIPDGTAKQNGIQVGQNVASKLLALRANDGSATTPPAFVAGTQPGDFRPVPPAFAAPVFTGWANVTPFVLDKASQFRPDAPPAVDSAAYANALNEVKSLGQNTSTTRTADETVQAKFWAGPIWNTWNEIADNAALAHHSNLETTSRLLAVLNLTFADGVIAFYDAKYHYVVWRPITAIRLGDSIGNMGITGDPTWTSFAATPADPSFPGAHSTISEAGATVLSSYFGDDSQISVTSDVLPGVTRTFDNYQAVAAEAGLSRIFAGVHTRLDHEAGLTLGRDVANFVLRSSKSADFGAKAQSAAPAAPARYPGGY
jgi:membrane-associated phospholipid phosphatase